MIPANNALSVITWLLCLSVCLSMSNEMEEDGVRHINWGHISQRTAAIVEAGMNFKSAGDTFLVIGANTGSNANDPMWKSLKAQKDSTYSIFVEPIPPFFKELQRNMQHHSMPRATCVNAAISASSLPLSLYCTGLDDDGNVLESKGFSPWCKQTCTTNKTTLLRSNLNTPALVEQYLREYTVPGLTVQQLLDTYAQGRVVRAVQIDVEGLDDMVVQSLPLGSIQPALIIFEAIHLSKKHLVATFKFLHGHDYYTTRYGQNGLAFKLPMLAGIPAHLRGAWTKKMLARPS